MGKFTSQPTPVSGPTSVMTTTGPALTHEGGPAFALDAKSDLLTLAAVNMVGEDTFYESAEVRDSRFRDLVWQVTREDPGWIARFVPYLRRELNMRSASVVVAAEYALCLRDALFWADVPGQGPVAHGVLASAPPVRQVIASALQRADEPGEFVAYWIARTGKRSLPGGVQRGVGDALARLYTERNVIKYDGTGKPWRLGDVVELAHASTGDRPVLEYLVDRRHHPEEIRVDMERLPLLRANREFLALPPWEQRLTVLSDPDVLGRSGVTWEILSSSGAMDKAAWEAVIPQMGVMALVRNLRNFDQAGISDEVAAQVIVKITSTEDIAKARMFPYQFLSAFLATESVRWAPALERATNLSTANVPALPGRWLILIDTSSSMTSPLSERSKVRHVDVAALFGFVAASRAQADVYGFAGGGWMNQSKKVTFKHPANPGSSVLLNVRAFVQRIGEVGHGTETIEAIKATLRPEHAGVAIFTDGQTFGHWSGDSVSSAVPARIPVVAVDTSGYSGSSVDVGQPNRWQVGGFSDKLFTMINLLTRGQSTDWPF